MIAVRRPPFAATGAIAVGALALLTLAFSVGTGNFVHAGILGLLLAAPFAIALAWRRPYLFPYGVYVVLVPFDNMLLIPGAGTLTKLLGVVSMGFVVLSILRQKKVGTPPLAALLAIAYMAWNLFSLTWAVDLDSGLLDATSMSSLVVMYVLFSVAPITERDLRLICLFAVAGGVLASLYGISLLHGAAATDAGDYGRLMIDVDNRRIDPNHFANSLLGPFALALVGLLHAHRKRLILASAGAVAILAAGVVISVSREALIGLVLIVGVLLMFSKRRALGLAIAIPSIAGVLAFVPAIAGRMAEAMSSGGAGRSFVWHVVWRAVQQHPLFGWGAGGALEAYDQNYLAVYQLGQFQGWTRPPHNTPLHLLVDLGIVGLVIVVACYLTTFLQFRGIDRGDRLYDLRAALTAALVALGFVSLLIDLANYKYLWIVLVMIAQLRTVARTRRAAP
ncbi:MAG TPA: O-antigen ligase family protein [Candidatus Acidoferrum sp.]|nr:O-antigen ligase family protein [Candidatus Acidoferrum sp.]